MSEFAHQSVMLPETLAGLAIVPDGIYVDATFGRGGHSRHILAALGEKGRLIAFDKDPEAIERAQQPPFNTERFAIEHASFATLRERMERRGLLGKVNGILLDCGVSSPQLDDPTRGFSFLREGPLDMRMDPTTGTDAATWLHHAKAEDIARVLWEYGEERRSRKFAAAIVMDREKQPFTTTKQLADLIERLVPAKDREKHKHPATRSFQAIRIYINNELKDLEQCLEQSLDVLSVGGRICAMSFHSLEDRIVKQFIQRESQGGNYPPNLPIKDADIKRRLRKVGKLIRPTEQEMADNPRARSARLRIAEKIS